MLDARKLDLRRGPRPLMRRIQRQRPATSKATPRSVDQLIALWRDLSLFAAAFAYLAGWTYIRSYYSALQVDTNSLDIPLNNYFVYAFVEMFTVPGVLLMLALIIVTALVERLPKGRKLLQSTVLVLFALVVFRISRNQGKMDAGELRANFGRLPRIRFIFKDASFQARILGDTDFNLDLFLIVGTKDKYFVLAQRLPVPPIKEMPAGQTLVIPASEVFAKITIKE